MSIPDRRAKLDRAHGVLSIRHQCRLLGLARSGVEPPLTLITACGCGEPGVRQVHEPTFDFAVALSTEQSRITLC